MQDRDPARPRLLVADDSKTMRLAASKLLTQDYEVVAVEDGLEAWKRLLDDPQICMVFSDLSMPRLDGYGLLERVRRASEPRLRDMAVIVITGDEHDEQARDRALAAGATDFITKPFDPVDLRARAQAHVQSTQRAAELQRQGEELRAHSGVDPVTGLANEAAFNEALRRQRSFAVRHKQELALVLVELDDFNKLLLREGKAVADGVLEAVGEVVRAKTRCEDTAARLGRARFGLCLPSCNRVGARYLAERVRGAIAEQELGNDGVAVRASAGFVCFDSAGQDGVTDLMERAQRALERAVALGGDRAVEDRELDVGGAQQTASTGQAATEPGSADSVDQALDWLAAGEVERAREALDGLLPRMIPLLRLAGAEQRRRLRLELE